MFNAKKLLIVCTFMEKFAPLQSQVISLAMPDPLRSYLCGHCKGSGDKRYIHLCELQACNYSGSLSADIHPILPTINSCREHVMKSWGNIYYVKVPDIAWLTFNQSRSQSAITPL